MTATASHAHEPFAVRGKLLAGTFLDRGTIVVENGHIAAVHRSELRNGDLPPTVIDTDIVSPGMIDLQVNGAIGREVGPNPANIEAISRWMPTSGVTAWLPTVVTADASFYPEVFASWDAIDRNAGAIPLGYHLEGPFLSPERKGAHQLRYIEAATDTLFESWLDEPSIALVTLAPERDGGLDRIRALVERGILTSVGHTNATYEQLRAGLDAGATKATHLFNAMSPMHHREPGAMIAVMTDDRVTAGLIPDGVHSHPATVRLALAAKGVDRIAVVSDMMEACGMGPGVYGIGGQEVTVDETSARLKDGTLAGSILTMDQAMRNLVAWTDVTLPQALHMATAVPARLLGDASRGNLVAGARADLTLWTSDLEVAATYVGGVLAAANDAGETDEDA
ncbi:MAG: N-acetylglucosamine-6-phosphate deacetylase [Thermomicrobiales bacterium]